MARDPLFFKTPDIAAREQIRSAIEGYPQHIEDQEQKRKAIRDAYEASKSEKHDSEKENHLTNQPR